MGLTSNRPTVSDDMKSATRLRVPVAASCGVPPSAGEPVPVGTKTCRLIFLFTDGFGQINGHGSSIPVGLLSFDEDLIPTPMKTRARISRKQTGESIPSLKLTRYGRLPGSHVRQHRKAL